MVMVWCECGHVPIHESRERCSLCINREKSDSRQEHTMARTHYEARPDTSGRPDGAWSVYDWNGMRIIWDLNDFEARRQAYSLNMTGHLTLPVRIAYPSPWRDAWFYKYAAAAA